MQLENLDEINIDRLFISYNLLWLGKHILTIIFILK